MKKILSMFMTVVMLFCMVIPASAAEMGRITLTGVNPGETYSAYKIFDVDYSTNSNGSKNYNYTIKADSPVIDYVESFEYNGTTVFTLTPNTADPTVLEVSVLSDFADGAEAAAKAFAQHLSNNLKVIPLPEGATGNVAYDIVGDEFDDTTTQAMYNVTEVTNKTQNTIYWDKLSLGYWYVTTTTGTLLQLRTTAPSVTVADKNKDVTVDKKVLENDTGLWKDDYNTVEIGETVYYKSIVKAKVGGINYVLHDKMTEGLTLNKDVQVFVDTNKDGEKDATEAYLIKDTDYTVEYSIDSGYGTAAQEIQYKDIFHVNFSNTYLATLTEETDLVVTYTAVVNENAELKGEDAEADYEQNNTRVTYGTASETEWDIVRTYTLFFDLIKIDSANIKLDGAKFELYYDEDTEDKVPLIDEGSHMYRVATAEEKAATDFISAVIEAGHADISGLDANTTYYLKEVDAPEGYNMVDGLIEIVFEEDPISSTFDATVDNNKWDESMGGIGVINKTGTELPSTGGMGTTVFYVTGAILVLAAGVILVTRRRMDEE